MTRFLLLPLLAFSFIPAAFAQEQASASGYHTMTFTSDAAEEEIYKRSPSAQAEAKKRATEQTPDANSTEPTQSGGDGFHRLTITPDDVAAKDDKKPDQPAKTTPKTDEKSTPAANGPTSLTPAKKLKPWNDLTQLYAPASTPEQIRVTLTPFEETPGRVPPSGLIQMASLYESLGDMKNAARYYYAAQLRARFDAARFGPKGELARKKVSRLANDLTARIGTWAAQSSTRLTDVLNDVRAWDAATPYDYHPGFGVMAVDTPDKKDDRITNDAPERVADRDTGTPPSESEWPDVLNDTREKFFRDAGQLASALQKMGK